MTEALAGFTVTVEQMKRELPIPYVLASYGYDPVAERSGKLHYHNPWREDGTESLDVFVNEEGVQRVGDYAIGFQGSVLDVMQAEILGTLEGELPWPQLMKEARKLWSEYQEGGWTGPTISASSSQEMDEEMVEYLEAGAQRSLSAFDTTELLSRPGLQDLRWFETFGLYINDGRLVAPYPDGKAIRLRYADGEKMFVMGSKPTLYHDGELENNDKPVLLVEGETDAWTATVALPEWQVVSIPGVGHQPSKHAKALEGRRIAIAFDGDDRGREGADRWLVGLRAVGCTVEVVPMPDRSDLSSLDYTTIRNLVEQRRTVLPDESGLESFKSGYVVMPTGEKGEPRHLSNWTLSPLRQLRIDGDNTALEVRVVVNGVETGEPVVLRQEHMQSANKLADWAAQFNGGWLGGARDHQLLRLHLNAKAAMLPLDQGTSRPGLHGMTFAWPGGHIGAVPVRVVEDPRYPYSTADAYSIRKVPGAGPETLYKLWCMHEDHIMATMLAWFAMAPLRSLYTQFPSLFVTGPAGSGKTTLTRLTARTFSGVQLDTNLTSTTPYALAMMMGGTNAFATFFDEFRPGANKSTLDMMKQLIRDAYTASASRRGGLSSNLSEVSSIETGNPLVISGEDFADEQSHRDRLIKVFLPLDGKGELIDPTQIDQGFAYDYLSWLTERYRGEDSSVLMDPPNPAKYEDRYKGTALNDRQRWNLAVLDCGWELLQSYAFDRDEPDLFGGYTPEWTELLDMAEDESEEDVVMSAIQLVLENGRFQDAVFVEGDSVYINSGQVLVALANLRQEHLLPFSTQRGLSLHLTNILGGQSITREGIAGGRRRYIKVPTDRMDQ